MKACFIMNSKTGVIQLTLVTCKIFVSRVLSDNMHILSQEFNSAMPGYGKNYAFIASHYLQFFTLYYLNLTCDISFIHFIQKDCYNLNGLKSAEPTPLDVPHAVHTTLRIQNISQN